MSKAVLFDMDGVLIDSYQAHLDSWVMLGEETGVSFSRDSFDQCFGRTSREIILDYWGGDLPEDRVAAMDARKEALFRELLADHLPLMPGVEALLDGLAASGFKLAVGSSGPPENVHLTVNRLGAQRFGKVVTGMDVTRGKPDPQVFLLGAGGLGVEPARCVVVEDAAPGVQAAHAAGMACVGVVSTGRTREQLAKADLIVDHLADLTPADFDRLLAQ